MPNFDRNIPFIGMVTSALPVTVLLCFTAGFVALHFTTMPMDTEVDHHDLLFELFNSLLLFVAISFVQATRSSLRVFLPMMLGLSMVFVANLTDALDELFLQPHWLSVVLEKLIHPLGYMVLCLGLFAWTRSSDDIRRRLLTAESIDPLTRAINRRCYFERLQDELYRCERYSCRLSVIALDVDQLHDINEEYGLAQGDQVLRGVSAIIVDKIRATDGFARVSGEEFELLLPNTGVVGAEILAQRLCDEVAALHVLPPGEQVRVSFGVTEYRPGDTPSSLRKRLEHAVIAAKKQGGGQVAVQVLPAV